MTRKINKFKIYEFYELVTKRVEIADFLLLLILVFSVNLVFKEELNLLLKVSNSSPGAVGFELKRH